MEVRVQSCTVLDANWNSVYRRHFRWRDLGVWESVLAALTDALEDDTSYSMDSTIVRGHVQAAGAKGGLKKTFGRSRGGFTCKVHALADARGRPLQFHLTGGGVADCKAYETLIDLAEQAKGSSGR